MLEMRYVNYILPFPFIFLIFLISHLSHFTLNIYEVPSLRFFLLELDALCSILIAHILITQHAAGIMPRPYALRPTFFFSSISLYTSLANGASHFEFF